MAAPQRFIALEEHCMTPHLNDVLTNAEASMPRQQGRWARWNPQLLDIGEGRIAAMDALGIDVQVLAHRTPGSQLCDPTEAVRVARRANDELATAIDRYPTRFRGFATLPIADPEASARELDRCVNELGFVGAMLHGRAGGQFLDHPELDPVLRAFAEHEVPLFLHPVEPSEPIWNEYYTGLNVPPEIAPPLEKMFWTGAWGWHVETGTHAIRMILSGLFDRYPTLQIILGHWGELVPFFLDRFSSMTHPLTPHLRRRPAEYFCENFYVTPSGLETIPPLLLCLSVLGPDRIMYAVDYPFIPETIGRAYIDAAPISDADKAKIAHLNAERVFRID